MKQLSVEELAQKVLEGSRSHMARAITIVESSRPDHRAQAHELLRLLAPHTGGAVRVGVTGVPGAGKSTFIDAMGVRLIEQHGQRVAVLAVDPSSTKTGGSVLGDRTRMGDLANRPEAFVRHAGTCPPSIITGGRPLEVGYSGRGSRAEDGADSRSPYGPVPSPAAPACPVESGQELAAP